MMDGSMMGFFWVWPLLVLVGLVLLGYLVFRLVRGGGTAAGSSSGDSSARRILDERYARGDIDEQEYRRRREGLQ